MAKISKREYAVIMKALHRDRFEGKEVPEGFVNGFNKTQTEIIKGMIDPNITTVFGACARKLGKTEVSIYILTRFALLNPGSACYYICPTRQDAKDIIWNTRRVQDYLGKYADYFIKRIDNRELVVEFKNGSFIQLRGAERYENANGLSPDILVYDEFKAFHKEFHRTMSMNKAAKGAKLLIIGTKADHLANNKKEYWAKFEIAKKSKKQVLVEATTWDNPLNHRPHIKEVILEDIEALRAEGREEVIQREYYNKIIAGGERSVFPLFNESFVYPHQTLVEKHYQVQNDLEWYQIIDPGTTSVFGGLFIAYNPYTGVIDVMDELYESGSDTAISKVGAKIKRITTDLTNISWEDWFCRYDEAGVWAAKEILDQFDVMYTPTDKNNAKKDEGLSLINHVLNKKLIRISDRCTNLVSEMLGYAKDDQGRIRKGDDHNIDSLRYFFQACNYTVELQSHKPVRKPSSEYKNVSIEDLLDQTVSDEDFEIDFDMDWEM